MQVTIPGRDVQGLTGMKPAEELAKVQEHDGQAGSSTIICLVEKVQDGLVPVHFVVAQLVLKVLE